MQDVLKDLRHAVRLLARKPGLSILAVTSLALGIGVNTAIFSLVNAILLKDLPMRAPERVVDVYTSSSNDFAYSTSSYPDFVDLRQGNDVFEDLVSYNMSLASWDNGESAEMLFGQEVSGTYFDFAGLPMAAGRSFSADEDVMPGTPVAVLGHAFWQERFGGSEDAIDQALRLNGILFTVVGVAPEPMKGTFPGFSASFWIPMTMHDRMAERASLDKRGSRSIFMRGRLKPGVTLAAAQAQFDTLSTNLATTYPDSNEDRRSTLVKSSGVAINPGFDGVLFGVAGLLMAVVGLVLLIACSNIANLLLARAADRRKEVAIRLALGAGRGRLIRQLLTESLVLATAGGALGLLFAVWTSRLIVSFQPPIPLPINLDLGLDPQVLFFTFGLALLTGFVCGLAPALQASKPDLVPALKDEVSSLGRGHRRFGIRNILVVCQVVVSTLLLIGAGLFLRSLANAQEIDTGFDTHRGVGVQAMLGLGGRYTEESGKVFLDRALERVRALPNVREAALVGYLPLDIQRRTMGILPEGHPTVDEDDWPEIDMVPTGPRYFETMGIEVRRGRGFEESDAHGEAVVVVNEAFASRYWPGEDPLGKRVRIEGDEPWLAVVGMTETGKYVTLGEDPRPFVYTSYFHDYDNMMTLVAATDGDENALLEAVRAEILALDSDVPLFSSRTLSEHLTVMLFPARMGAILLAAFGVLGLVLASVGLYGVVAVTVAKRTREVGIRMAIGATGSDVVRLVVKEGLALVAVGIVLGSALALAGTQALATFLYGISPTDPLTFGAVALVLIVVAAVANLVPAGRATRIDPVVALRYE